MTRSLLSRADATDTARAVHTDPAAIRGLYDKPAEVPAPLAEWLGRLMLLHGIPFDYLVPDDRMLPMESIRFFTVDENWLCSLVDGANSIGRIVASDLALDRAIFAGSVIAPARRAAGITASVVTGFLIRSALIEGWWPGIKIDGFPAANGQQAGTRLKILRLDRLSPSVGLCLFDGQVERLNIHEPAEGLHFGLDKPDFEDDPVPFYRQLRSPEGELLDRHVPLAENANDPDGCLRLDQQGKPTRTLKVNQLAHMLAQETQSDGDPHFTAAEFALEMVEGVDLVGFRQSGNSGQRPAAQEAGE